MKDHEVAKLVQYLNKKYNDSFPVFDFSTNKSGLHSLNDRKINAKYAHGYTYDYVMNKGTETILSDVSIYLNEISWCKSEKDTWQLHLNKFGPLSIGSTYNLAKYALMLAIKLAIKELKLLGEING